MPSQARILEAARGEFALHGYSARLQDIASRAGLTHPTLLYHFKSKELLYAAVIEDAMHDWAQMTSAAETGVTSVGHDSPRMLASSAFVSVSSSAFSRACRSTCHAPPSRAAQKPSSFAIVGLAAISRASASLR